MPDPPSRRQTIVSLWKRWRKNPIMAGLVFFVMLILGDIIITPVHPITAGLFSMTLRDITSIHISQWVRENIIFISFLIASIVVGILAQWQVNQASDKRKETEKKLDNFRTESDKSIQKTFKNANDRIEEVEQELQKTNQVLSAAERDKADLQKQVALAVQTGNYNRKLWKEKAERAEEGQRKVEQELLSKRSELDNAKSEVDRFRENYNLLYLHCQDLLSHKDAKSYPHFPDVEFNDVAPQGGKFTTIGSIEEVNEVHKEIHDQSRSDGVIADIRRTSNREEFDSFIEPLYSEFQKDPSLSELLLEDSIGEKSSNWDKAAPVISMFKNERRRRLTFPRLQKLIEDFLKYKEKQIEKKDGHLSIQEAGEEEGKMVWITIQIEALIKERYNELDKILHGSEKS